VTGATVLIASDPSYVTQCTDGTRNETAASASAFDADDYSCSASGGLSELEPAPTCYDGVDNDADGRMDEQDPDCTVGGAFRPESDLE
jgi:hypothetical protein